MINHMKSISTVVAITLGALISAPASAQEVKCESVDLLFNRFFPPHIAFVWAGMEPWAEDVMRVTEGRVKVSFPPSSLAPAPQQWNMILDSVADVAVVINPIESNRLHLPNIAGLPFVGNSSSARGIALWRTHEKYFADANEFAGVHLLGHYANIGAGIISGRPLAKFEDIEGMKLWSIGGPPAEVVKAIGGIAVPAPGEEMFNMYSKGVVDGLVTNKGTLKATNSYRYTKTFVQVPGGLYAVDSSFIMNQAKWDSICPADQAAITSVSGETIARNIGAALDEYEIETHEEVLANNIPILHPDEEFLSKLEDATSYAQDAWIKRANARGVDGQAALDYFLGQVSEITAELDE